MRPSPAQPPSDTPAGAGAPLRPLPALQSLRGVAALLVVLAHTAGAAAGYGFAPGDFELPWGYFGVDIFFVISGFIIVYSSTPLYARRNAPLIFLWKRITRVAPLYWIMTSIYIAYLFWIGWTSTMSPAYVASSYFFIPSPEPGTGAYFPIYFPGWTLQFEMFFYGCFALVLPLSRPRAVLAVSGIIFAVLALGGLGLLPPTVAFWSSSQLLEFFAGCIAAELFLRGWRVPPWAALVLSAAAAAWAVAASYRLGVWPPFRGVVWGVPAAALVAAAALRSPGRPGAVRAGFARLGDASYSLYVVHILVLDVVSRGIQAASPCWQLFPTAAYMAFLPLLAVGAAFACHVWVERPLTRGLQRLKPAASAPEGSADLRP